MRLRTVKDHWVALIKDKYTWTKFYHRLLKIKMRHPLIVKLIWYIIRILRRASQKVKQSNERSYHNILPRIAHREA